MKPLANPAPVCLGDHVDVYWNVHARTFSIRRDGKVIKRTEGPIWLALAVFHVSDAGRERVRAENRKNVHAWISGEIVQTGLEIEYSSRDVALRYDPYLDDGFVVVPKVAGAGVVVAAELVVCGTVNRKPRVRAFGAKMRAKK